MQETGYSEGGKASIEHSLQVLKASENMSLIGVLLEHRVQINILPILIRQIKVQGVFCWS